LLGLQTGDFLLVVLQLFFHPSAPVLGLIQVDRGAVQLAAQLAYLLFQCALPVLIFCSLLVSVHQLLSQTLLFCERIGERLFQDGQRLFQFITRAYKTYLAGALLFPEHSNAAA